LKKKPVQRKRPLRKWLNDEEYDVVQQYRRIKDEAEKAGINHKHIKSGWLKSDASSLYFTNPAYKSIEAEQLSNLHQAILEDVYAPKYPKIKRKKSDDGHLMLIDPADVHIGKLCSAMESGEEYDQQIAVNRVRDGVHGLLNKSSGWNIEKILFVAGNDILHIDSPKRTTTSGTPQDTDGMWFENFINAKKLYIELIETLMQIAPVHFVYNPSNHDYMSGFFLAQVIEARFKNCVDVTFDISIAHRKYSTFGSVLIGTTHGDGAKWQDLPLLMAHESETWSKTKHRYIFTHHIHHKQSKDHLSVCIESMRSPSGTDSWHHRNGYQHSPKAIEAYLFHPLHGQIARLTHLF